MSFGGPVGLENTSGGGVGGEGGPVGLENTSGGGWGGEGGLEIGQIRVFIHL